MAPYTSELAAVTHRAGGFVRNEALLECKSTQPATEWARPATIRILDLYVAYQPTRHLRKMEPADMLRFGHSTWQAA